MKKMLKWIFGVGVVVFALIQFINPARTNPPVIHDFMAATTPPSKIAATFRAACYDCHSYETKWPWYSHVAPVSWLVAGDVKEGRRHLNFSDWPVDDPDRAASRLENMGEQLNDKEMPPVEYTLIHADARLTAAEHEQLIQWMGQEAAKLKSPAKGK
jgi:Haem-binding domain